MSSAMRPLLGRPSRSAVLSAPRLASAAATARQKVKFGSVFHVLMKSLREKQQTRQSATDAVECVHHYAMRPLAARPIRKREKKFGTRVLWYNIEIVVRKGNRCLRWKVLRREIARHLGRQCACLVHVIASASHETSRTTRMTRLSNGHF